MAPEIVLDKLVELREGSVLLDPMCGSGTVLRAGLEAGLNVIGIDVDPLAILMAKAWCKPPARVELINEAHELVAAASVINGDVADLLDWVDDETARFIEFWFADPQRADLAKLAHVLATWKRPGGDALRVALSRIIVTKDRGASLGRDISHSRPHKVAEQVSFDVLSEFLKSVRLLSSRLHAEMVRGSARVEADDSRKLDRVADESVDLIVTSPPYLNALDYLRGHRLSLVWLGHTMAELRSIRSASIGAERILRDPDFQHNTYIQHADGREPPAKLVGWSARYRRDAVSASLQFARVLRPGGEVVLVVGNSQLQGFKVDNAQIYADALAYAGLEVIGAREREIPTQSRYLPTPTGASGLALRMRTEIILTARGTRQAAQARALI